MIYIAVLKRRNCATLRQALTQQAIQISFTRQRRVFQIAPLPGGGLQDAGDIQIQQFHDEFIRVLGLDLIGF
ncbi:hypothetical protein V8J88_16560 [Massilia sp. W12]|uniref:hypothetical protein n=1 Tax=Massilia sp. W12 TaxID=3126507 RepID=UPI0030CB4772